MKCPLCNVEMRITNTKNIVRIVEDKVHLFISQDLSCMNKNCANYDKVVTSVENEQPVYEE